MNKKAKFLLVALSAAAVTTGAFALAGCKKKGGDESSTPNPSATEMYENYKTYAQENNKPVLTYEQWLETIQSNVTIKGDKGDQGSVGPQGLQGTQGPEGKPGEAGEEGRGVETMVWGEKDGVYGLIITYSDGTESFAALPKDETHVHGYDDDNVITLIPATEAEDGLGYKACQGEGCDHVEMVLLTKRYIVTVTDMAAKPVEGATVTINGASAVTDKEGKASVSGYGYKNDYIVSVAKEGYAVAGEVRTGADPEIAVALGNELEITYDPQDEEHYFPKQTVKKEGAYTVTVKTKFGYAPPSYSEEKGFVDRTEIRFVAGETPKYFKLTPKINYAEIYASDSSTENLLQSGEYSFLLLPGEQKSVYFSAKAAALGEGHNFGEEFYFGYPVDGDPVKYMVTVEELELPEAGTELLPIDVVPGAEVTIPASATGPVYYRWVNNNNNINKATLTLSDGATATFTQKVIPGPLEPEITQEIDVTSGTAFLIKTGNMLTEGSYFFKVTPSGETKFTFSAAPSVGTIENPQVIEGLGDEGVDVSYDFGDTASFNNTAKWFKYTVSAEKAGKVTVTSTATGDITVYNQTPSDTAERFASFSTKDVLDLAAGEYYFSVNPKYVTNAYSCAFKLAAYDPDKDLGCSAAVPNVVVPTFTATDDSKVKTAELVTSQLDYYETVYYSFTAPSDGELTASMVSSSNNNPNDSCAFTFNGKIGKGTYKAGDNVIIGVQSQVCDEANKGVNDVTFTCRLTWEEKQEDGGESGGEEVAEGSFVFTVKDPSNNPVAGVKITIYGMGFRGEVELTSGTTGADGKVTIDCSEYMMQYRGEFTARVSECGADYTYSDDISVNGDTTSYTVDLKGKTGHTFTVKAGETAIAGVTVKVVDKVYNSEKEDYDITELATGTTNTEGKVTLNFLPGYHTVLLEGYNADNYYYGGKTTDGDAKIYDIVLRTDKTTFNITVTDGAEKKFAGATVIVHSTDGKEFGRGTTNDQGAVTITDFIDKSGADIMFSVIPAEADSDYALETDAFIQLDQITNDVASKTINLKRKTEYTVTMLNVNGAPLAKAKLELRLGEDVVDTATTDANGVAVLKGIKKVYTIVCVEGIPEGYCAAKASTAYDSANQSFTITLAKGDIAAAAAPDGTNEYMIPGLESCQLGVGVNAISNAGATGTYYFKASTAGTYTFTISGESETSYFNYIKAGYEDVLINNGHQVMVANGIVLGANRGIDKAYQFSIELNSGEGIIIGYATGTEAGGKGEMTVTFEADPNAPVAPNPEETVE